MTLKTLNGLRASDFMSTKVITLPQGAPLREAIATFEDEHITGVPVVDLGGKVVGVLSEHDLARASRAGRLAERSGSEMVGPQDELWDEVSRDDDPFTSQEDYNAELIGQETVGDWMNPKVVSVTPDTPLKALCRTMVDESIHRLVVLEKGRALGIVTTSDVVRLLAERL